MSKDYDEDYDEDYDYDYDYDYDCTYSYPPGSDDGTGVIYSVTFSYSAFQNLVREAKNLNKKEFPTIRDLIKQMQLDIIQEYDDYEEMLYS